jgi:putative membrane protein
MVFELKTLASINIVVQTLLILLLNYATFLAKKRDLRRHCNFIRIAAGIQIAAIVAIMWEALLGYLYDRQDILFNRELLIHHSLGILLILVWIYINLAYAKKIRSSSTTLKNMMRSAYIIWTFAFILGLHIYSKIYL